MCSFSESFDDICTDLTEMTNSFNSLHFLLYCLIHLCNSYQLTTIAFDIDEPILGMANNGRILAVATPLRMLFYSMDLSEYKPYIKFNSTISFDYELPINDLEFELLEDNSFLMCWTSFCVYVFYVSIIISFLLQILQGRSY